MPETPQAGPEGIKHTEGIQMVKYYAVKCDPLGVMYTLKEYGYFRTPEDIGCIPVDEEASFFGGLTIGMVFMHKYGVPQDVIAELYGKNQSTISRRINAWLNYNGDLDLPRFVASEVEEIDIPEGELPVLLGDKR